MGIYMVCKKAVEYIPENTLYGFDHLMLDLINDNQIVNVKSFNGYWLDIGRPDDYMQAIDIFENDSSRFLKG
jgi:NDP-sugar pyrophosphorylase family protein